MSEELDKKEEVVVTLLSNGSSHLFKDNTLTHFSNKLHTPIILKPSNDNYITRNRYTFRVWEHKDSNITLLL